MFQMHFSPKIELMHVTVNDRSSLEAHMRELIDAAMRELGTRSAKAENQKFEQLYLNKIGLSREVQAYFLQKLAIND